MYITEEQFDLTIEKAFTRGMEFQKRNQKDLENAWFDIGFNAALKTHGFFTNNKSTVKLESN